MTDPEDSTPAVRIAQSVQELAAERTALPALLDDLPRPVD